MKRAAVAAALFAAAAPAFAARPVARWDVVPDQRVSGVFRAGVCAFHEDGVTVEFSIGGEVACVADAPTRNPRTGVWEYVFPLNTALLPDGPVVLGARAVTQGASPEEYVLPDLPLYANGGGSLSVHDTLWVDSANGDDAAAGTESAPLATLAAAVRRVPAGGTVLLKAGEYSAGGLQGGSDRPYWTTVAAAPGVARDAVQIAGGRPSTQRLLFRGVSLYCDAASGYAYVLAGENGAHSVWLDDCKTYNRQGRWGANSDVFGNRHVGYVTGGLTTDMNNGPDARLIRGHEILKIASDVWTGSDKLVVNSTASDVDAGSTGAHPDFHQSYAVDPDWVHDVVLYNVTGYGCRCQGLFGVRLRDSAFVNVVFERTAESDFVTQYSGPMENVLFAHVMLVNQNWLWRGDYAPAGVRVLNGCMAKMSAPDATTPFDGSGANGLLVSNCFFYAANGTFGLRAASGDPLFADAESSDYSLLPGSPALANFGRLACVPADFRGVPWPGAPAGLRTLGAADGDRFDPPADRTWPANPGDAAICLWKDDAFAAGSITIDDNCAFDHDWWLEQTRTNGIPLTWFAITDRIGGSNPAADGTWPGWQRLVDAGHSVQSHSTNHRHADDTGANGPTDEELHAMYRDSLAAINANLTNNAACCIAYPDGEPHPEIAAEYAIACRGTVGQPNEPAAIDYLNVRASSSADVEPYLAALFGETVESPAWLNKDKYRRGWFVSLVHGVQTKTNAVGALVRAFASRRPDLWVDTFPRIAKYGQERDTAVLRTRSVSANRVVLMLSDAMDDALFDEPLTVKVRLPGSWTNFVATQDGAVVRSSRIEHGGASYALVDAVPDAGAVVLQAGGVVHPPLPPDPPQPHVRPGAIALLDWPVTGSSTAIAADSPAAAAIYANLASNDVDFAYLHACKASSAFGDGRYGFFSAGTDLISNSGYSLFLGCDTNRWTLLREYPNEAPYRYSNAILAKAIAVRGPDDTTNVLCAIAGQYLNASASTYAGMMAAISPAAFRADFPGARVIYAWDTGVNSRADREATLADWAGNVAGCVLALREEPLVVYVSEPPRSVRTRAVPDPAASGDGGLLALLDFRKHIPKTLILRW